MLNTQRAVAAVLRAEVSRRTLMYAVEKERPQYSCNSHKRVKYLHVFFTNEACKKKAGAVLGGSGWYLFELI